MYMRISVFPGLFHYKKLSVNFFPTNKAGIQGFPDICLFGLRKFRKTAAPQTLYLVWYLIIYNKTMVFWAHMEPKSPD